MRYTSIILLAFGMLWGGCRSDLYSHADKWLLRDNAVPRYAARYDVIYVGPNIYNEGDDLLEMHSKAVRESREKFSDKVRYFAPLVNNRRDFALAMKRYLRLYHGRGERPFVLIGQGDGGRLLHAYFLDNERKLVKRGLIGEYYFDGNEHDFVNPVLVVEIEDSYIHYHNTRIWGRDMLGKKAGK